MGFFSSIKKMFGAPAPAAEAMPQRQAEASGLWREHMAVALRRAEPRLSAWLGIILDGVADSGPLFRERLAFLFDALEAPQAEKEAFIASFMQWLDSMGYFALEEFRSELQYKLALALDMEDEEDERSRLLVKFAEGLAKTREQLGRSLDALLGGHSALTESLWEELEELLIAADVGVHAAGELTKRLRRRAAQEKVTAPPELRCLLREELCSVFKPVRRIQVAALPEVALVVGVNGAGKTTTIAKLACRAGMQGKKTLIAAGDTFRAAAVEQLELWALRAGAGFYAKKTGSDPASVAFEALEKALAEGYDALFIDTAGRLQTKANLMEELVKIRRVLNKRLEGAPNRTILVLDATTGQNALSQARLFNEACPLDEIIVTKADGTAKGGIVASVAMAFGIPITYMGFGEKMEDLRPFDAEAFARALVG